MFITLTDGDKAGAYAIASRLEDLGFRIVATAGTAQAIRGMGVRVDDVLKKVGEGSPNVVDRIEAGEIDLVINTPTGSGARADGWEIRRAAIARGIPCITTLSGAHAAARAISAARNGEPAVLSLQELHRDRLRRRMRTLAPLGRRRVRADRRRRRRRLPRPARRRPDRSGAAGGAVLHARRRRGLGRGRRRAAVPAAGVLVSARHATEQLSFMLEDVGPGTHRLGQLGEGDALWLTGPLGLGFRTPHDGRRALLAGGGVGVPPLSAWARTLAADGEPVDRGARLPRRAPRGGARRSWPTAT